MLRESHIANLLNCISYKSSKAFLIVASSFDWHVLTLLLRFLSRKHQMTINNVNGEGVLALVVITITVHRTAIPHLSNGSELKSVPKKLLSKKQQYENN